jgi:hypothetical protein
MMTAYDDDADRTLRGICGVVNGNQMSGGVVRAARALGFRQSTGPGQYLSLHPVQRESGIRQLAEIHGEAHAECNSLRHRNRVMADECLSSSHSRGLCRSKKEASDLHVDKLRVGDRPNVALP